LQEQRADTCGQRPDRAPRETVGCLPELKNHPERNVRRAAIVLTAVLLAPSAGAFSGTLNRFPDVSGPAQATDNANRSATIISTAPAYSTEVPAVAPSEGQPAAAVSASSNGFGYTTTSGVPDGTVRMLLSLPPAGSTSDN
jgi:hypothetical protein